MQPPDVRFILDLLFETYPFYYDKHSQHAVKQCLITIIQSPLGENALAVIVEFLKKESTKTSIAPADSFTLVDWCAVLLQQYSKRPELWNKYGLDTILANATILATCMSSENTPKTARLKHSALVRARRALRALFRADGVQDDVISKIVGSLTSKGTASKANNAVFLGVVAGVSSRLPTVKPKLDAHKQDYFTFYTREIVGSRAALPAHISSALYDFFNVFPTIEEIQKDVIPSIEKALLRAPEVVLNDLVGPTLQSLPESMDLSKILLGHLLKPLLSNIKSSNATIRSGAVRTFGIIASRSKDEEIAGKVADEILNPLKAGKVPSADQRILHAQLLSSMPTADSLAKKIPTGIVAAALKEQNEQAAVAEVSTLTKHLAFGLQNNLTMDKTITDAFVKGMADKRIPIRRLWALRAGDIWWSLSRDQAARPDILAFCQTVLPKLVELWQEVTANPIPATQSGMVTVGHYVTAILLSKVRVMEDEKLVSIYKKLNLASQLMVIQPKPSFLLNPRVYTKLSSEEDIEVALRAMTAVAPWLSDDKISCDAQIAWSQALIYFIVAQGVPSGAIPAAKRHLTEAYIHTPAAIAKLMADGLWTWYRAIESHDKDSAAVAAKSDPADLSAVLNSLFLPRESLKKSAAVSKEISKEILERQCIEFLVLARSEIVPNVSWIDLCLRTGVDPGELARHNLEDCLKQAMDAATVGTFHR